jgi:hypothetical protein
MGPGPLDFQRARSPQGLEQLESSRSAAKRNLYYVVEEKHDNTEHPSSSDSRGELQFKLGAAAHWQAALASHTSRSGSSCILLYYHDSPGEIDNYHTMYVFKFYW